MYPARRNGRSDRSHLHDFGDVVPKHVLDSCLQCRGRARAPRARTLHVEIDDTVLVILKDDVSAILRDRRTHACLEQLLDLGDDFVLVFLPRLRAALSAAPASITGRPAVKCSMITARIKGFSWYQSPSASFVTVIKSAPRKTPVTCGRANSRSASGDTRAAASASVKFAVPEAMTMRPGRNFRVAGFGVCSVWMNIDGSRSEAKRNCRALSMVVRSVESTLGRPSSVVNRGSARRRSQMVSANCVELL